MDSSLDLKKKRIREGMLSLRNKTFKENADSFNEKAGRIWERIKGLNIFKEADYMYFYAGFGSEPPTLEWIKELSEASPKKRIALPRVIDKGRMEFRMIEGALMEALEISPFGIFEPRKEMQMMDPDFVPDLIIVPGVGFDLDLNRLGYGGGYYDRFISHLRDTYFGNDSSKMAKKPLAIAAAFECQIVYRIPISKEDQKMDLIVTEDRMIKEKAVFI
ncbi:MAG: 5-formyltetrahydrofolate cyclo-ligase [Lachnospiraceae bacterium]|nr:5-formyltetrahydrofolate cyclo-ligase [Lachnospiraceae bacterium]